jgi:hypothetical protein
MVHFNSKTGAKRKQRIRDTNYWKRSTGLQSKAWTELMRVHRWIRRHTNRRRKTQFLFLLSMMHQLGHIEIPLELDDGTRDALSALLAASGLKSSRSIASLEEKDSEIADMAHAEANVGVHQPQQRWSRIDDFETDNVARQHTRFLKEQLREIYDKFEFPIHADGYVRVTYGEPDVNGRYHLYRFHPEELFVYAMIKAAKAATHTGMAEDVFGGIDGGRRWSVGYKWVLEYVTTRYKNLLGIEGIRRWIPMLPEFAERIRKKIVKDRVYYKPSTDEYFEVPGTWFDEGDFNIAFFLDGVFYPFCKPWQGPDGDYIGAMRIEGSGLGQQMIYGHKGHGVIMLSFMFPNGIHCWYGPVSARRNEKNILIWSGVDDMLHDLQTDIGQDLYSGFGDKIFWANIFRCIKASHKGDNLTERQIAENSNMNKVRIVIEWDFGAEKSQFKACADRDSKKLLKDCDSPLRELQFCGLLKNIYNCFNGNGATGDRTFACPPPDLDEYLYVVPDPIGNPQTYEERLNIVGDPLHPSF